MFDIRTQTLVVMTTVSRVGVQMPWRHTAREHLR